MLRAAMGDLDKANVKKQAALDYHSEPKPGKIEVIPTKAFRNQRDLSLAYTPGVAEPCLEIEKNADLAYKYTTKGNLVAVVSNGTAVLGLGDIGALAGKPVMEGKGILFKAFGGINVFDIEINAPTPKEVIDVVSALEPTFGGINLEDIKAPECFEIEETLIEKMNIPVFHDDQHGTAIISAAGLLNALDLVGKKIDKVKVVFSGAGAAAIATARLYASLGVKKENMLLIDQKGVVYEGRPHPTNKYKQEFCAPATEKARTLADALVGADVFVGVSKGGIVSGDMIKGMADKPIVFAMANPDPEITPAEAKAARPDVIMATGRSDYPNQVNNVLGFPFIFRGALDVRARKINVEMKLAAVHALAKLAREDVPDIVKKAYSNQNLAFGPEYIIPKPFDPRLILHVPVAVAEAAMKTGVARIQLPDLDAYRDQLEKTLGKSREVMRPIIRKAQSAPKRIVFPESLDERVLHACQALVDEKIATPILLGLEKKTREKIAELGLDLGDIEIINPEVSPKLDEYAQKLLDLRAGKGINNLDDARVYLHERNAFGAMMVKLGDADGLLSGSRTAYAEAVKPTLEVIKPRDGAKTVSGLYVMLFKNKVVFFADTTVNIDPDAETLAEIAIQAAEQVRFFTDEKPRIAMLSHSSHGTTRNDHSKNVARATQLVRERRPDLEIDGEIQADLAVDDDMRKEILPRSTLTESANVLIFPDLESGNIAYKLMLKLGGAEAIGPILLGMGAPVNVLQRGSSVNEIVNMTAVTVVQAQELEAAHK
jgi:malate dehydrogenase (oxaloacetate-decarboxylating)(NADP+)